MSSILRWSFFWIENWPCLLVTKQISKKKSRGSAKKFQRCLFMPRHLGTNAKRLATLPTPVLFLLKNIGPDRDVALWDAPKQSASSRPCCATFNPTKFLTRCFLSIFETSICIVCSRWQIQICLLSLLTCRFRGWFFLLANTSKTFTSKIFGEHCGRSSTPNSRGIVSFGSITTRPKNPREFAICLLHNPQTKIKHAVNNILPILVCVRELSVGFFNATSRNSSWDMSHNVGRPPPVSFEPNVDGRPSSKTCILYLRKWPQCHAWI